MIASDSFMVRHLLGRRRTVPADDVSLAAESLRCMFYLRLDAPANPGIIARMLPDNPESAPPPPEAAPRKKSYAGAGIVVFVILLGVLAGLGSFTFGYGKGSSYLSNNPAGCANCHVMQDHFDSWQQSSHHHVAVCNDCHLPHDFVGKWVTKADNGFFHSVAFTLQDYHQPIQIKPRNQRVTQNACIHCHRDFVHALLAPLDSSGETSVHAAETQSCVHCHSGVGHALR
jgi:cytochrome c nitrite reductase small subunit